MVVPGNLGHQLPRWAFAAVLAVLALALPTDAAKRPEPSKFVVLTTQRSGSTWLCSMLDSHPEIDCKGEIFDRGSTDFRKADPNVDRPLYHDWPSQRAKLATVFTQASSPIVGFNQMYNFVQGDARTQFVGWAAANNVTIVHLIRRNRLESYMSHYMAKISKQYFVRHANDVVHYMPAVNVSVAQFLAYSTPRESARQLFRHLLEGRSGLNYIEVTYEAFESPEHSPKHLRALLAFLGASDINYQFNSKKLPAKVNFQSCEQRIENWANVKKALLPDYAEYIQLCERSALRAAYSQPVVNSTKNP